MSSPPAELPPVVPAAEGAAADDADDASATAPAEPVRVVTVATAWAASVGDDAAIEALVPADVTAAMAAEPPVLDADSETELAQAVVAYADTVAKQADAWGKLFIQIPKEHKRRTDALQGAIKVKAAAKIMQLSAQAARDQLAAPAAPSPADDDTDGADMADPVPAVEGEAAVAVKEAATAAPAKSAAERLGLLEYQQALKGCIHGLMEITVPIDEKLQTADKTQADCDAALGRLDAATELVTKLGDLFYAARVDPGKTAEPKSAQNDALPPELIEMLTKKMAADKKPKAGQGELGARTKQQKQQWAASKGKGSQVLSEELWEVLCWRKAILRFMLIKEICDVAAGADADASEANIALVNSAIQCFHTMLRAKGPIASDLDDPSVWGEHADGPLTDETERLFHHGVYSSTHLRGLKHKAELCYWRWKHFSKTIEAAELAALVNRKFTHIVRHIMPGAGWTADVEYSRVCEIEAAALGGTTVFSVGIDTITVPKPPPGKTRAPKKKVKAIKTAAAAATGAVVHDSSVHDSSAQAEDGDLDGGGVGVVGDGANAEDAAAGGGGGGGGGGDGGGGDGSKRGPNKKKKKTGKKKK